VSWEWARGAAWLSLVARWWWTRQRVIRVGDWEEGGAGRFYMGRGTMG
jgi:hypothetical protein